MATFLFSDVQEVPASGQIDLQAALAGSLCNLPVWISFAYWVVTPDVLAGAFNCDINYTDPNGNARVINGSPISLASSDSFFSRPVEMVLRESLTSSFTFDKTLIGGAGDSIIRYNIFMTGVLDEITSQF